MLPEPATNLPKNLYLTAKTLVDGLYQGRHATPDRGAGSNEFFDYRMYTSGDPASQIDWKVFGRTDRLYLRRFQHFGNLTLQIIIDGSASMNFAAPETNDDNNNKFTKWQYASQLAAALALLAIRQSERVALAIAVSNHLEHFIPPAGSWAHLYHLIHTLEDFTPHSAVRLDRALVEAQQLSHRKHLIFILSDFLTENTAELATAIQRLRYHGHDIAGIQILTSSELYLADLPAAQFFDPEKTSSPSIAADPTAVADEYRDLMQNHITSVRNRFTHCGADHFLVETTEPSLASLRRILWDRQRTMIPAVHS